MMNELCEICVANKPPYDGMAIFDIYWINTHCIELIRNRKSRENKNTQPKKTIF